PELRGLQHVGLVDTAQALLTLLRSLESHMRNTAYFAFCIMHGVEALALALELAFGDLTHAARLAKIDIASQLTHNQDIQTRNHFWFERRGLRQLWIQNGRP